MRLKAKLKSLSIEDRKLKSKKIAAHLQLFFLSHDFATLALSPDNLLLGAFAPLSDEPHWPLLLESMGSIRIAFPTAQVVEGEMKFVECGLEELTLKREFGVELLVPPSSGSVVTPNVFLVPGLGFTKSGQRLGRGKGYYDRYLAGRAGVRVGICFAEQILDELPTDDLDQEMNFVITDNNIYRAHNNCGSFKE